MSFHRLAGHFSISIRLWAAFGVLLAWLFVIAGIGYDALDGMGRQMTRYAQTSRNSLELMKVVGDFEHLRAAMAQAPELAKDQSFQQFAGERDRLVDKLAAYLGTQGLGDGERAVVSGMVDLLGAYDAGATETIARQRQPGMLQNATFSKTLERLPGAMENDIARQLSNVIMSNEKEMIGAMLAAQSSEKNKKNLMLLIVFLGVATGVAGGLAAHQTVAKPVGIMTSVMSRLKDGDRTVAVPFTSSRDEVGQMASAVEMFKRNLVEVDNLQVVQEQMRGVSEVERRSAMVSMADTVEQDATTAIGDITGLIGDMADHAAKLLQVADSTSQRAAAGATAAAEALASADTVAAAAQELDASIAEIARQVVCSQTVSGQAVAATGEMQGVMSGMSTAVQKIGSVVEMISGIANQTNLLALNATIEAARAGETGKGFAIVAGEVKALARQTGRATEEIAGQVAGIRDVVSRALDSMSGLAGAIREVEAGSAAISAAIEQQSAATSEIARAVGQTAEASGQVSELMAGLVGEAGKSRDLSEDVKKDGERVKETAATFRRAIARVVRSSSKEVCRRQEPRFGVFLPCRLRIAGTTVEATITTISRNGMAITAAPSGMDEGSGGTVEVDCGELGGARACTVMAANTGVLHTSLAEGHELDDAMLAKVAHLGATALINKARSDHEAFVRNALNVIEGTSRAKAADLANHHTCRLGKWYDAVSDQRVLACPSYGALAEPHKHVHAAGKALLTAFWQGDQAAVAREAEQLQQASRTVIDLLGRLAREVDSFSVAPTSLAS